jgi:hypothetical protein
LRTENDAGECVAKSIKRRGPLAVQELRVIDKDRKAGKSRTSRNYREYGKRKKKG